MSVAVIEVDVDSVRLLVASMRGGGLVRLREERALLYPDDLDERARIVNAHARVAREFGVAYVDVLVTETAEDGADVVRALEEAAGATVRVLAPDDAARLLWQGAVARATRLPETVAVCEVRAHTTTIVVGTLASGPVWMRTAPVGATSLTARFTLGTRDAKIRAARAEVEYSLGGFAIPLPKAALATPVEAPTAQAGLLILAEAQRRLGVPIRIAEGGVREGAVLALAGARAAA